MHSNMNTSPAGLSRIGKAERKHKVVVIKVGTSSLLRKGHLHLSMLGALAEACSDLSRAGCKVIVVTSGAVGAGCQVLGAVRAPPFSSNPRISSFRPPLAGTARSPAAAPAARRAKITLFRDETVSRILHGRKDVFVAFAGVSEARARRADRRPSRVIFHYESRYCRENRRSPRIWPASRPWRRWAWCGSCACTTTSSRPSRSPSRRFWSRWTT